MAAAISAVSSFQSTPSGGKATASRARRGRGRWCFNPRLPGGRRPPSSRPALAVRCFNPRLPGGRRLGDPRRQRRLADAVSIHAFRGEGDLDYRLTGAIAQVSIHAFRGEGDARPDFAVRDCDGFNPRLPGGRRPAPRYSFTAPLIRFNPRLPGGRRLAALQHHRAADGFNPRLPGGRRPVPASASAPSAWFQSTPSGGKATETHRTIKSLFQAFQSTPSGGKATSSPAVPHATRRVSIHAFRGEGDSFPP